MTHGDNHTHQESDVNTTDELVARFLSWPLPDSVCADLCATQQQSPSSPPRVGTNLLTADEARQMLRHVLGGETSSRADRTDQDVILYAMVEGLHAMIYGVYSTGSDDYARKALADGGSIHEYVHAMLRLLPDRSAEQIPSGGVTA
jgi:hypothetical protein